ncbi:small ubiquitin-related modifier 3 [Hippopotamus amphibius kiboko]|uniref:small ubiquitin-related modifier 3 n=1 Tax=Hippopotamus amphibius kiboko TaxID=575201 RepID=UPI002594713D|nr:small ubiquitin-related modifier 3 [Hippopotamus amphibius kiboko]
MSEEKPKEGVKTENDHISLKVAGQDGSVVQFKIKRHTPLSKLMRAYCERQGLSMRQIRFRFDGQPINETDTPAQLEMEDEDTIDVFRQQTGGSRGASCLPGRGPWSPCALVPPGLCLLLSSEGVIMPAPGRLRHGGHSPEGRCSLTCFSAAAGMSAAALGPST